MRNSIGPKLGLPSSADPNRGMPGVEPGVRRKRWLVLGIYLALACGTFAVFSSVVHYGFIDYDDDAMIFKNRYVSRGLTLDGLRYALTESNVGNWLPLTTLSQMLDCEVFTIDRPGLHHLESLCLHVATVLLLFEALRRMTGEVWPSALVAALFAIHPLRVESVVWVTERKDVLSGLFWMLTLLAYAWYARRPGVVRYLVVGLCFVLGLLSKPMLVTLPCVLLLLDFWPLRRWRPEMFATSSAQCLGPPFSQWAAGRLLLEKVPLLVAALAVAGMAAYSQVHVGSAATLDDISIPWRLVNATTSYVWYLWKTVWPTGLAVFYPHPSLAPGATLATWIWPTVGAAALLLTVSGFALWQVVRRPYLAVGWFWYLGTLLPVIGLMQVGSQARADRFTYLPMIGVYLALAWAARDMVARWPAARFSVSAIAGGCLIALAVTSWIEVGYWRDSETLFRHALEINDDNAVMHQNLGVVLARSHRFAEAITHYERVLQLNSTNDEAENNFGCALVGLHRHADAIPYFERALELRTLHQKKDYPEAQINLADALLVLGKIPEAIDHFKQGLGKLEDDNADAEDSLGKALSLVDKNEQAVPYFRRALKLKENFPRAHADLGNTLRALGRTSEAIEHFERAVQLEKNSADARYNLGNALLAAGKTNEGIEQLERAVQLKSDLLGAQYNLGNALLFAGRANEAVGHFERVVQLNSDFPDAELRLANALDLAGNGREAIPHYERALQWKGDDAAALNNLAALLAKIKPTEGGNPRRAVVMAEKACRLTGYQDAGILSTLADAYAAANRLPDAIATAQKATLLARSQGQVQLADEIEAQLTRYKAEHR